MSNDKVLSYDDVRKALKGTCHLLLGNGFSIACNGIYAYGSLYEFARPGLPERVGKVFEYLGTNNFEGVMRLLRDGGWLASEYESDAASATMAEDLETVKNALVKAVADTHLDRPGTVGDERLARCVQFLAPYTNVFSVCYDLLLYWVAMHGLEALQERDGFRHSVEDPGASYCVFREHLRGQRGILFIHGALHIYVEGGEVRKHTWTKTGIPLIELIRQGLTEGQYPLFVAEGDPMKKRDQILRNGYLDYCSGKFTRIEAPLVTFGFSFGETDLHITNAIVTNLKLSDLYVGVHEPASEAAKTTINAAKQLVADRKALLAAGVKGNELHVHLYDTATCAVWDAV